MTANQAFKDVPGPLVAVVKTVTSAETTKYSFSATAKRRNHASASIAGRDT